MSFGYRIGCKLPQNTGHQPVSVSKLRARQKASEFSESLREEMHEKHRRESTVVSLVIYVGVPNASSTVRTT